MKRIKNYFSVLILVIFLIIAGCSSNTESNGSTKSSDSSQEKTETITLKFASPQPETHTSTIEAFKPFMERVTELTDGQVQWEFYPGEQLGKAKDMLDLTSTQVTDIGYFYGSYYPDKMPIGSALLSLPGAYSDQVKATMVYQKLSKQSPILETDYLSNGVRPLFTHASPVYEIFTKGKEVRVPEDLKGMKIRVSGATLNQAMTFTGATPVNISVTELYEGLDRGVIDGTGFYAGGIADYGLDELVTYTTIGTNLGGVLSTFVINEDVFQGLPKSIQDALIQAGNEITESNTEFFQEETDRAIKELKETGITVYELSAEESKEWEDIFTEFTENWVKEYNNKEFNEVYNTFKEELEN